MGFLRSLYLVIFFSQIAALNKNSRESPTKERSINSAGYGEERRPRMTSELNDRAPALASRALPCMTSKLNTAAAALARRTPALHDLGTQQQRRPWQAERRPSDDIQTQHSSGGPGRQSAGLWKRAPARMTSELSTAAAYREERRPRMTWERLETKRPSRMTWKPSVKPPPR